MGNEFTNFIRKLNNSQKIKGRFTPIINRGIVEEISTVYTVPSKLSNLPIIYVQTTKNQFLGITLARQSSDFIQIMAKNYLRQLRSNHHSRLTDVVLMQYRFPGDLMSLKLVMLINWVNMDEYAELKKVLTDFQAKFLIYMKNVAKNMKFTSDD